jgi:hypothetical protein
MRGTLFSVVLLSAALVPFPRSGQVVNSTVCDILANPQSFDGKIVRLSGTVTAGFDEFVIKGSGCHQPVNAIWLTYPEGTDGKAGPVAYLRLHLAKNSSAVVTQAPRAPVSLEKN